LNPVLRGAIQLSTSSRVLFFGASAGLDKLIYNLPWDDRWLYLKFAGETLIDVTLTCFKEAGHG
jgi:hypothetical protein